SAAVDEGDDHGEHIDDERALAESAMKCVHRLAPPPSPPPSYRQSCGHEGGAHAPGAANTCTRSGGIASRAGLPGTNSRFSAAVGDRLTTSEPPPTLTVTAIIEPWSATSVMTPEIIVEPANRAALRSSRRMRMP